MISPPIAIDSFRLISAPDIGAMKLAAIAGRGRKRDFYDLFFLLHQFSLTEILGFYQKKYEDGSEWMVLRSLTFFEDADQDEDILLISEKVTWEEVKRTILLEVKKFFGK